jgi:hypothetical protein
MTDPVRARPRHQGQVTVPRLVAQLRGIGVSISKRQVMLLLIAGQDGFLAEARDVLRAGLETAAWISVDDTGARNAGTNGFCTQIGNDDFAWFGTRTSTSGCLPGGRQSRLSQRSTFPGFVATKCNRKAPAASALKWCSANAACCDYATFILARRR